MNIWQVQQLTRLLNLHDFLLSQGYTELRLTPQLTYHGLFRFIFTCAIVCDMDFGGYECRYCFHTMADAQRAFDDWEKEGFQGDPQGYIVKK